MRGFAYPGTTPKTTPRPYFMPLFTQARGRWILRTSQPEGIANRVYATMPLQARPRSFRRAGQSMLELINGANLLLRFLLELCALGALGYWGFKTGSVTSTKVVLGVGAPLVAAVVRGTFLSPSPDYSRR
jgi:Protein of unknown function (DUF2568)